MDESIKLAVTVRSALNNKYTPDALKKIDTAVAAWIAAEIGRGIKTVLVNLDSKKDMEAQGLKPLAGKVTAVKAKKAIDALAKKLSPDYIVILGGHDVVPYFVVPNPSAGGGDVDDTVPTDNPYATSRAFVAASLKSYLVPDRVVGRIPDLPAAKGKGDPATILAALKTAMHWKPQPKSFFSSAHAMSTATWEECGRKMMKQLQFPEKDLQISPPSVDSKNPVRKRLSRTVHMFKCHGADADANFYGEDTVPAATDFIVLFSGTLANRAKPGSLVAAVCCYGANVYSPSEQDAIPQGALPVSIAYLHAGALGFMGSTKIAWVGGADMMCADSIVVHYLEKAMAGASLGRAMLEAKQDYMAKLQNSGQPPEDADEKTMIEFVLLGDPAIHPIASTVPLPARTGPVAAARRATLRAGRRVARAVLAGQVEKALPTRTKAAPPPADKAVALFKAASALMRNPDLKYIDPKVVASSTFVAAPPVPHRPAGRNPRRGGESGYEHARNDAIQLDHPLACQGTRDRWQERRTAAAARTQCTDRLAGQGDPIAHALQRLIAPGVARHARMSRCRVANRP